MDEHENENKMDETFLMKASKKCFFHEKVNKRNKVEKF
jgi:hypothetical protein